VRAHLLAFVTRLRTSGVRVSVAETIDAMSAIEVAGVAREVLREALAATLVKDESDRAAFDAAFDEHFPLLAAGGSEGAGRKRGPRAGGAGAGGASGRGSGGSGGGSSPPPDERAPSERSTRPQPQRPAPPREHTAPRAAHERRTDSARERALGRPGAERAAEQRRTPDHATRAPALDRPGAATTTPPAPLVRRPFAELEADDLDQARDAAREIGRRFVARVSRRSRRTRRGTIDIRRTIRRAVARGGALIDLQRRGRRPGKPNLVVLCDVSGSVARASDLLLTMLAAAEGAFARVARFVFVDRLVAIEYVDQQIRPDGELDYHARSDLGPVLGALEQLEHDVIDRKTVLLVLGDARNNRRPARADVLRRLAQRARAVVWIVPEPRARWDTGDSALAAYATSCDLVVEATSLSGLLAALRESAR